MSTREVIEVQELEDSTPYSFEQCIRVGDRVFVAGQTGVEADGTISPSFERQVRRTFERIEAALEAAGATFADLVHLRTYLTDMRHKRTYTDIRGDVLGEDLTTSALIGVASLARPEMSVEVVAEAIITDR